MRNEAKRSEKFFVSFAKQSENQAKRDAFLLFSLRSEKIKQAKMGHPSRTTSPLEFPSRNLEKPEG